MKQRLSVVISVAATACILAHAAAQTQPAQTPATAAPGDAPLAGPKVPEPKAAPTLVECDMAGKIRRLDIPPGEAALKLLTLDDETKKRTDAIVAERAAILDRIVVDNLELIIQIHNASEAGDKAEAIQLLNQAAQKLRPLRERGPLETEFAAALPGAQREAYWKLVKEYQSAMVRELMDEAKAGGEDARPLGATIKSSLIVLGGEIKRSYERQVAGKAADFEKVLAKLDLSAEQETRVRNLVTQFAQDTKGKPTAAQKRNLFLAITSHLTLQQQKRLLRYTLGGESPG